MLAGVVAVAVVSAGRAAAQSDGKKPLAGKYTIDPKAEGPNAFASLERAIEALERSGVSGSVEIVLPPGDHEVALELRSIDGAAADKTVTFRGAKSRAVANSERVVWTGKGGPIVTLGDGAEHVVFAGITFKGSKGAGAVLANAAVSSIEIRECTFLPDLGRVRDSILMVDGRGRAQDWHIHHNTFRLQGASYGFHFSMVGGFDIHDNLFELDGVRNALYFINKNDAFNKIHHNTFLGTADRVIHVAASNLGNFITSNVILTKSTGYAIETFGTTTNYNRIFGNLIVVEGGGGGIFLSHQPLLHVRSDGNVFCLSSGKVGTIRDAVETECTSLAMWREATTALPLGICDKDSAMVDPKFLDQHEAMLGLLRTGSASDPAIAKQALGMLGETDLGKLRFAIHTLARAGHAGRQAIPMLAPLLRHKDRFVRADAAYAIGAIRSTAEIAVPDLQGLLGDEEPLVIQSAARALAELVPFSRSALADLQKLRAKDYDDRGLTAAILDRAIARIEEK